MYNSVSNMQQAGSLTRCGGCHNTLKHMLEADANLGVPLYRPSYAAGLQFYNPGWHRYSQSSSCSLGSTLCSAA